MMVKVVVEPEVVRTDYEEIVPPSFPVADNLWLAPEREISGE